MTTSRSAVYDAIDQALVQLLTTPSDPAAPRLRWCYLGRGAWGMRPEGWATRPLEVNELKQWCAQQPLPQEILNEIVRLHQRRHSKANIWRRIEAQRDGHADALTANGEGAMATTFRWIVVERKVHDAVDALNNDVNEVKQQK